jgi:predicted oxidoreductase
MRDIENLIADLSRPTMVWRLAHGMLGDSNVFSGLRTPRRVAAIKGALIREQKAATQIELVVRAWVAEHPDHYIAGVHTGRFVAEVNPVEVIVGVDDATS